MPHLAFVYFGKSGAETPIQSFHGNLVELAPIELGQLFVRSIERNRGLREPGAFGGLLPSPEHLHSRAAQCLSEGAASDQKQLSARLLQYNLFVVDAD